MAHILGIHHVTAIAGDAQRNLDFYAGLLGLRLVKRTVNFDDPGTYHFYFGDERGTPGSILTFFPWQRANPGRPGNGQVNFTSLAVPAGSLGFWIERLITLGIPFEGPARRFDEQVLTLRDPDGLIVELVATAGADGRPGWGGGDVPAEHSIRGVHAVTVWVDGYELTARLLVDHLGFRAAGSEGSTYRYVSGEGGSGTIIDVRCTPDFWKGAMGVGVVHHVAWRAADDDAQLAMRERLAAAGLNVTPQLDRNYFRSVYFREPGGVLFEIATDAPGFDVDEPLESLGTTLRLPPWLEPHREEIAAALPPVHLPEKAVRP